MAKSKAYKIGERIVLAIGVGTAIIILFRVWALPGRLDDTKESLDALELEVKEMRIEHGERLARIEGHLFRYPPLDTLQVLPVALNDE